MIENELNFDNTNIVLRMIAQTICSFYFKNSKQLTSNSDRSYLKL